MGEANSARDTLINRGDRALRHRRNSLILGALLTAVVVASSACTPDSAPEPTPAVAARAAHTATLLADGRLLVAGGCDVDGCTTATGSSFLLSRTTSEPVAPLGHPRDAHTAVRLGTGQVLVVGGFGGEGQPPLASAELFEPASRTWVPTVDLRLGRGGHAAAVLGDGRVIVAGGWVGPRRYTATTEIYDPVRGRFDPGPALPVGVDGLAATSLPDGTVLITGGQRAPGVASDAAVLVRRDGSTTESVGPLREARFKHTMITLPTGEVLVIGGTSDDRTLLAGTEIFDPRTRRFRAGPTTSAGRYKLAGAATLLPDGRVLVAGAGPGLEIIDPVRFTSRPVENVTPVYSAFSTASVLGPDLRIVGGYDQNIRLTHTDLTVALSEL